MYYNFWIAKMFITAWIIAAVTSLPAVLTTFPIVPAQAVPDLSPQECKCTNTTVQCAGLNLTHVPLLNESSIVEVLNISFNDLHELTNDTFRDFPSLRELHAGFDRIVSVEPFAFRGLQHVTKVDLTANFIKFIHPDSFRDSVSLETVLLSRNPLLRVSAHAPVLTVPSLLNLFLSGCKLSRVSHNFFSGVPRLQTLDLSSNNFTSLSRDSFAPLSNLTNLDLGNNPWPCSDASLDVLCFAASLRKEEKRSLRPVYCYDRGIRSKRLWSESLNTECKVQSSDGVTEDPDVTWQRPERDSGVSAEVYVASLMLVALILSFAVMCMMRYSGFCSPLRLFLYGTLRPEGET
ncbi:relaxin receptor 1-like isoform X2 [Periplaneta americana]|uniref:relaxin receptor 1-like isoform X2 n=1 Tax=Periplaneta americana TaxID=6978 RepID=UPI0037E9B05B